MTDALQPDPQKIEKIKEDIDVFLYEHQEIVIETKDQYTNAADLIKVINQKAKKIEEKRKEYTQHLVDAKRVIDNDFKRMSEPLDQFVQAVKTKMREWYEKDQVRLIEEQKRLDAEAMAKLKTEGKSETTVQVITNQNKTVRGDLATITVRKVWTYRIVDENAVPDEFWAINEKKIGEAVRSGTRHILGIEIFQENQNPTIR